MVGAANGVGGPSGPPAPNQPPKPAPAGKGKVQRKGEKKIAPKNKGKKSSSTKLPKGVVDVRKLKTAKKAVDEAEPEVKDLIAFVKKVRSDLHQIASSASKMAGQLSGHRSAFVAVICCLLGSLVSAAVFGDAFRNTDHLVWTLWAGIVAGSLGYLATDAVDK